MYVGMEDNFFPQKYLHHLKNLVKPFPTQFYSRFASEMGKISVFNFLFHLRFLGNEFKSCFTWTLYKVKHSERLGIFSKLF